MPSTAFLFCHLLLFPRFSKVPDQSPLVGKGFWELIALTDQLGVGAVGVGLQLREGDTCRSEVLRLCQLSLRKRRQQNFESEITDIFMGFLVQMMPYR
jgi:hypothetical protein